MIYEDSIKKMFYLFCIQNKLLVVALDLKTKICIRIANDKDKNCITNVPQRWEVRMIEIKRHEDLCTLANDT